MSRSQVDLQVTRTKTSITATEFMRQLEADSAFMERKREREKYFAEREAQSREAQKDLVKDLASVGVNVATVWDLVNSSNSYDQAIPLLLDHLRRPYPDGVREGIARSLAMRSTRKLGWQVLVSEYRVTEPSNDRVKDGLAVALSAAADDSVLIELIELAKDETNGSSRLLLLRGIKRSRLPEAARAIDELATDPELEKEIKSWRSFRRRHAGIK